MRVIAVLAMLFSLGCQRLPSHEAQGGALRLVAQSDPLPALLIGELNGMKCKTWFQVRNEGENEINVKVSSKSCSCVDSIVDEKPLQIGDSFALAGGEQKKIHLIGRVAKVASIQRFECALAASDGSDVVLEGSQSVYADTECAPTVIAAPMPRGGGDIEESVEVVHAYRATGPRPPAPTAEAPDGVTILSVLPHGDAKQVEHGLWRQTWRANLKVRPDAIAGGFATLRLAFDKTQASIPIKVTQAFGIAVLDKIAFGTVRVGEQRKRRVVMHAIDGVPFKVLKARSDSPEVTVSVAEAGTQSRYWVDFDFQPTDGGEHRATVSIETTHPDSQRLAISTVGRGW